MSAQLPLIRYTHALISSLYQNWNLNPNFNQRELLNNTQQFSQHNTKPNTNSMEMIYFQRTKPFLLHIKWLVIMYISLPIDMPLIYRVSIYSTPQNNSYIEYTKDFSNVFPCWVLSLSCILPAINQISHQIVPSQHNTQYPWNCNN